MPFGDGADLRLSPSRQLDLPRCPHCFVAHPVLSHVQSFDIAPGRCPAFVSTTGRISQLGWSIFACTTCGGAVCAAAPKNAGGAYLARTPHAQVQFEWIIPAPMVIDATLPSQVKHYLGQAQETLTSPSASVLMSAAAVDAILKNKGYKKGTLHERIEEAVQSGIITKEMGALAHDVRLDANAERHVDEASTPPTHEDAKRCFDFAEALAELIYVLPARVKRGTRTA